MRQKKPLRRQEKGHANPFSPQKKEQFLREGAGQLQDAKKTEARR